MAKYKKKPVIIEAIQLSQDNWMEVCAFIGISITKLESNPTRITIQTLEGDMTANIGDWTIRGVEGELYPCKDSIFQTTYEKMEA